MSRRVDGPTTDMAQHKVSGGLHIPLERCVPPPPFAWVCVLSPPVYLCVLPSLSGGCAPWLNTILLWVGVPSFWVSLLVGWVAPRWAGVFILRVCLLLCVGVPSPVVGVRLRWLGAEHHFEREWAHSARKCTSKPQWTKARQKRPESGPEKANTAETRLSCSYPRRLASSKSSTVAIGASLQHSQQTHMM